MFDLKYPKWIIQNGELRMGRVVSHRDLAEKNIHGGVTGVKGGGFWRYEEDGDTLLLYGESIDFGQVSVDDFEDVWMRPPFEKSTILFSTERGYEDAKKNNILIQDFDEPNITAE